MIANKIKVEKILNNTSISSRVIANKTGLNERDIDRYREYMNASNMPLDVSIAITKAFDELHDKGLTTEDNLLLGLDLSLNSTGYAIYDIKNKKVIEKGTIKVKLNNTHHEKINHQYKVLSGIKERYNNRGHQLIVAKEQLLFRPARAASVVAKVHGVVDLIYKDIYEYYPNTIKKQISGNGHASKEEMEVAVTKQLKQDISFESTDEVDAVAVCLMYCLKELTDNK